MKRKQQTTEQLCKSWYTPRFQSRFYIVLGLALAFYFIAGNTGCGWIYLLSTTMLAALLIALIMPLLQLASINVELNAKGPFVAGQQASITAALTQAAIAIPVRWCRLTYPASGQKAGKADYIALDTLDQHILLTTQILERGIHPLGTLAVSSCFPTGLMWWRRCFTNKTATITVYPKTVYIDGFFLYKLAPSTAAAGGPSRGRQAVRQSTSTRGIREYARGDSPRIVHWTSTARAGKLLVREFEAEGLPQFDVLLDLAANWQSREQFELAATAASSLLSLGHRLGIGPGLLLNPGLAEQSLNLPPIPDGIELQREILARVNPIKHHNPPAGKAYPADPGGTALVVIRPESPELPVVPNCYVIEIAGKTKDPCNQPASAHAADHALQSDLLKSRVSSEEELGEL